MIEAGIYVHVPFCVKKCYYCDFNSYTLDRKDVETYLDALRREAECWSPGARETVFDTLFIGGGTPTCLSGRDLGRLIDGIRGAFRFSTRPEWTSEANPGSSNEDKFAALLEAGVGRLSIGVQSLDDAVLARIGRAHTASEALGSIAAARRAGCDNLNVDLMFALPGQSLETWQETVRRVVEHRPEHLSCYSLIVEEGTPFGDAYARGRLSLPGEDIEYEMYEWAIDYLTDQGYEHYEISNFALPGKRSRHNQIYWRIEPYIGLGPGAHGYWAGRRYSNVRLPGEYAERLESTGSAIAQERPIDRDEEMDDTMIFGLRLLEGVEKARFERRFGRGIEDVYGPEVRRMADHGLLDAEGSHVRLTRRGIPLANQVFAAFLRTAVK